MRQITLIVLLVAFLSFPAAFAQTRSRLVDYALVLEDAPVAQKVRNRAALQDVPAQAHLRKLRTAQGVVLAELNRRKVAVTGAAQVLVNAVFVRTTHSGAAALRGIPGVTRIQYLPPVKPDLTTALNLTNVAAAWSAVGGDVNAGAGIRIGIIDTGIDQNHPGFLDTNLAPPQGFPKGDAKYTNNKVIVARSYVPMLVGTDPANTTSDDVTPRDRVGHGTAIAMIAAGVRNTGPLGTIVGVAPKAFLGNYKIFGSPGVNDYSLFPAINKALEDALADGMDVVTLSLNEGDPALYGPLDKGVNVCGDPVCDVRAQAVEAATAAGMAVVTPAGNDGNSGLRSPVLSSLHTPGTAPSAITVGATMNSHLLFQSVRVNGPGVPSGLQNVRALFGDGPRIGSPLTAAARDVARLQNDGLGCSALPAGSLAGAVAVIQRGTCVYSEKITNAQNAGAVGVILYQLDGIEDPVASLGVQNTGIPAVMIGNSDGKALKSYLGSNSNATVSLDPAIASANNGQVNTVAPFSSRGPSLGNFATTQDFALKPELVAPGTDLYTAAQKLDPNGDAYNASGYTAVSGTSYAVGMVAGAVALVKQKNSAIRTAAPNGAMVAKLKSAVVNTASGDVQGGAHVTDVGAGKLNAGDAVNVAATLEPAAISFGAIAAGALPINRNVVITNVSSSPATFSVAVRPVTADSNARVQVPPANVTLSPGTSSTLTISLTGLRPASGAYEGFIDFLDVTGASPALHLPYLYLVGSGVPNNAFAIKNGGFLGLPNETDWLLGLKVVDQYGVPVPNAPVSFRVQSGGGKISRGDNATDRLGIAAVFIQLGPQLGEQVFIGTAGGLSVEFDGYARPLPSIKDAGVVNAATFQAGQGLAPGSYISIFGDVLADATAFVSTPALPLSLASVAVSFDGGGLSLPGHLHFVSPGQINVQIPWEFQGQTSVKMKVTVSDFLYSNVYTVPLAAYSPGVFGTLDQVGGIVSASNPARRGQVIQIYANGLGDVDLKPASGDPTPSTLPLAKTKVSPTVTIGGSDAPVFFSGLAPGFVGLYQVNATIPANAPTGTQPLKISIGGIDASVNLPVQ